MVLDMQILSKPAEPETKIILPKSLLIYLKHLSKIQAMKALLFLMDLWVAAALVWLA